MRDMTDTMYNPERPPGVSHFDGTDLVVEHVETLLVPELHQHGYHRRSQLPVPGRPPACWRLITTQETRRNR